MEPDDVEVEDVADRTEASGVDAPLGIKISPMGKESGSALGSESMAVSMAGAVG